MARNLDRTKNALLDVPGPAPTGTVSGSVVALGSAGLFGWALTDRITQADIDNMTKIVPQGLKDGEASFELIGVSTSVNLTVDAAVTQWARVYKRRDTGAYTPAADTGGASPVPNDPIGYALATTTAAGLVPVGLAR